MQKINFKLYAIFFLCLAAVGAAQDDLSCVDILNDLNSTAKTLIQKDEMRQARIARITKRYEKYGRLSLLNVEKWDFEILQKKTQQTAGYMVQLMEKLENEQTDAPIYLDLFKAYFQAIVFVQKSMQKTFDTYNIDDRLQNMLPFVQSRIALNHAKISLLWMTANGSSGPKESAYRKTVTFMLNNFDQKDIEKDADVNKDHSIIILRKLVETLNLIETTVSRRKDADSEILLAKVQKKHKLYSSRLAVAEKKQRAIMAGALDHKSALNSSFGLTFNDLYSAHSAYEFFDLGTAEPDYNEKIIYFGKAIEQKPDFLAALVNRGVCYDAIKMYDKAILDYSRALEIEPKNTAIIFYRGGAFMNVSKYDQAVADFLTVTRLEPLDETAWLNTGICYEKLKNDKQAQIHYNKAISIAPHFLYALKKRAMFYQIRSDYKKAIADYERIIELAPKETSAWYNTGAIYYNLRLWKKAINAWEKCLALNPDHEKAKQYLPVAKKEARK